MNRRSVDQTEIPSDTSIGKAERGRTKHIVADITTLVWVDDGGIVSGGLLMRMRTPRRKLLRRAKSNIRRACGEWQEARLPEDRYLRGLHLSDQAHSSRECINTAMNAPVSLWIWTRSNRHIYKLAGCVPYCMYAFHEMTSSVSLHFTTFGCACT